MRHVGLLIVLAVVCSLISNAWANDGVVGGMGAQIKPLSETRVRLERERVVFYPVSGGYEVYTLLTFYNPTEQAVKLQVGFPLNMLGEGYDEFVNRPPGGGDAMVGGFETSVNGERIQTRLIKGEQIDTGVYMKGWDSMYVFDVEFAPRRHTVIQHRYTIAPDYDSMGESQLNYVFSTGGGWAGKIEEAAFEFRLGPWRPRCYMRLNYGDPYGVNAPLVGGDRPPTGEHRQVDGIDYTAFYSAGPESRLTVTFYNIDPTQDLSLVYRTARDIEMSSFYTKSSQNFDCGEQLQEFAYELQVDDELLKCFEPQFLVNIIYAWHGYHFANPEINEQFYGQGFYFESNEPFDKSWLSPEELTAISTLRERLE